MGKTKTIDKDKSRPDYCVRVNIVGTTIKMSSDDIYEKVKRCYFGAQDFIKLRNDVCQGLILFNISKNQRNGGIFESISQFSRIDLDAFIVDHKKSVRPDDKYWCSRFHNRDLRCPYVEFVTDLIYNILVKNIVYKQDPNDDSMISQIRNIGIGISPDIETLAVYYKLRDKSNIYDLLPYPDVVNKVIHRAIQTFYICPSSPRQQFPLNFKICHFLVKNGVGQESHLPTVKGVMSKAHKYFFVNSHWDLILCLY